jgi:hypothetical protein
VHCWQIARDFDHRFSLWVHDRIKPGKVFLVLARWSGSLENTDAAYRKRLKTSRVKTSSQALDYTVMHG